VLVLLVGCLTFLFFVGVAGAFASVPGPRIV
jgi:hypothetical protein